MVNIVEFGESFGQLLDGHVAGKAEPLIEEKKTLVQVQTCSEASLGSQDFLLFDQILRVVLATYQNVFVVILRQRHARRWRHDHMVIGERQVEDFGQIVDQLRRAVGAICYKDERHLVGPQFLKIKEQTPSELPSDQANQSQRLAYMNGLF